MQIIAHRRNTIQELISTPVEYGVEMDIRSYGDRLIVHHEPFVDAIGFEEWIKYFNHKTLILNIKEESIEYRVKKIVEKQGIKDYFFLDLLFPSLIRMIGTGEKRVAVRFSEYESMETALSLAGKAEWVWVDCFTKMPLTKDTYKELSKHFKICIVSPELQGKDVKEIMVYKEMLKPFKIDAVCTKRTDLWLKE